MALKRLTNETKGGFIHLLIVFAALFSEVKAVGQDGNPPHGDGVVLNGSVWKLPYDMEADWQLPEKISGKREEPLVRRRAFSADWKFQRNGTWETVDLPHDFSIGMGTPVADTGAIGPFSKNSEGGPFTGHTLGGVGQYRKTFLMEESDRGKIVKVHFDGIYSESDVWINGHHLGFRPNGYVPFFYELTPYLHFGNKPNEITVKCRNSGQNSRWYAGSGIYRYVHLSVVNPVHIDTWGLTVMTRKLEQEYASIGVSARVMNRTEYGGDYSVRCDILDRSGTVVTTAETAVHVRSVDTASAHFELEVPQPRVWSVDDPFRYKARVTVLKQAKPVDTYEEWFGIRTIRLDTARGLLLNGRPVLLKGANVHHDHGFLGAKAFAKAEWRKVSLLKANGFNAIRTAHNPPSETFLEACDELGMLVLTEFFDMWERPKKPDDYHRYFREWHEKDVANVIARDKNRPSVMMWSIGNEINERADSLGVGIAKRLVDLTHRLDPSRPVTAGVCDFWDHKGRPWEDTDLAFKHLDLAGYNYRHNVYGTDHGRHPGRLMVGTESFAQEAYDNWQKVIMMPWVIGDFVWTGMDYIGEAGIGHSILDQEAVGNLLPWPWYNAWCGDLDITGAKKPQSYYRDVVWGRSLVSVAVRPPVPKGSRLYTSKWGWPNERRSWTWPGHEGQTMTLAVYSPGPVIRVRQDGKLLSEAQVQGGSKLTTLFKVIYRPGKLEIDVIDGDSLLASTVLETVSEPAGIVLEPDTATLVAGGDDLVFVNIRIVDRMGNLVPHAAVPIQIGVTGAGQLEGCGNADPKGMQSFNSASLLTYEGRALAVIRSGHKAGDITVTVTSDKLPEATCAIGVRLPEDPEFLQREIEPN